MNSDVNDSLVFRVLPLQVIEYSDGFILRRGSEQFTIVGAEAVDFIRLFGSLQAGTGFSLESISQQFAKPDQEKVKFIIRHLASRGMVIPDTDFGPEGESNADVFYWNLRTDTPEVVSSLNDLTIALVGLGRLSLKLANILADSGLRSLDIIDDPLLRTIDLFESEIFQGEWPGSLKVNLLSAEEWRSQNAPRNKCLVASTEFGGRQLLLPWNEICVEKDILFLPIVLKDFTGWVGPLVIPGETPCFQCLTARQNMHLGSHESLVENAVSKEQIAVAGHPVMINTLANLGVMRLLAHAGRFPVQDPDSVQAFDFIAGRCEVRRVLKIPRCPVCSQLNRYPETDLHASAPLPH